MPRQIQISEIENGWLVMTAPEAPKLSRANGQEQQAQQQPVTQFCEDHDAVTNYIKSFFPIKIIS